MEPNVFQGSAARKKRNNLRPELLQTSDTCVSEVFLCDYNIIKGNKMGSTMALSFEKSANTHDSKQNKKSLSVPCGCTHE